MPFEEHLQTIRDRVLSNKYKGGDSYRFKVERAINSILEGDTSQYKDLDYDQSVDIVSQVAADMPESSPHSGMMGAVNRLIQVPGLALETAHRVSTEGKGGFKTAYEAYKGKRGYKVPAELRLAAEIIPFFKGYPQLFRKAFPKSAQSFNLKEKLATYAPKRESMAYGTYGTERGATVPPGAPHTGARMGKYYGREGTDWGQYTKYKRQPVTADPLVPRKHPVFYGTGVSPITQFEEAGGGLLDKIMKGQVQNINKGYRDTYTMGINKGRVEGMAAGLKATELKRYGRPDTGGKTMLKGAYGKVQDKHRPTISDKDRGKRLFPVKKKGALDKRLPDGGESLHSNPNTAFGNKLRQGLGLSREQERMFYARNAELLKGVDLTSSKSAVESAGKIINMIKGGKR